MTCRELVERLCEYADGELDAETAALIREHIGCCPPCVHYVRTYKITIEVTRRLPLAALPPELEARIRAAFAADPGTSRG